jgi:hypothetical protein
MCQLETEPGQNGERSGATGSGAACSGERFGECFSFATELHREAFLTMR